MVRIGSLYPCRIPQVNRNMSVKERKKGQGKYPPPLPFCRPAVLSAVAEAMQECYLYSALMLPQLDSSTGVVAPPLKPKIV